MKGFIVYPTYELIDDKTIVQLFGRLENGQSFVITQDFEPYFFMLEKDFKKIPSKFEGYSVEKTLFKNFNGDDVVKIKSKNYKLLISILEEIDKVETFEADIKPHMRYLIDNNVFCAVEINDKETYESSERIDRIYRNVQIKPCSYFPNLKVVSIDIEYDKENDVLFCIGIYSEKYKKNFMVTKHNIQNTISCKSEFECLEKFKAEILNLDPDIITGWNIVDFDFQYLQKLFRKNQLNFDIGRTTDSVRLRLEKNFFRTSSADVPGRQVLDGLALIKDPFIKEAPSIKKAEFDSWTLEDVARTLLGKEKTIKGKDRHRKIEELYRKNTLESHTILAEYNLTDCELAYNILKETKMIELALERCQLTGLSLDKLTASIAAFDSLYIREARKKNIVSPTMNYKIKENRIRGGYVHSLKPGVYKNVIVLDFKSLYPSIIRTFNIDPFSHTDIKEKNVIEAPNGAFFRNQEGFLPNILARLHSERERAKKEKRELSNYAIKIIMNSFFGVLASPNSRYFNLKIANAITYFGQFIIKLTTKEIEKKGYSVIYSDTDSVFVETNLDKEKANSLGKEIQDHINNFYKEYVRKNYSRNSELEIQFEKQYLMMLIPKVRGIREEEGAAAKKRYAGLREINGKEELEVVGLEAIRGDWTEAAKDFQVELLEKLFHNEPVENYIRDYLKKIRNGKLDDKLVYRKSIRKSLEEYTKTTPPHVKAARKLKNLESNVIEYYMTVEGPEPLQNLKHKIDYEHYIEKQIKPIANQILSLFNKSFEEITEKNKQTKLF